MTIISLEGSRRSGKTYISGYLRTHLREDCVFLPTDETVKWLWKNSPPIPQDYASARAANRFFLEQTARKYDSINCEDKTYILQRDYLSHLAFASGLRSAKGIDTLAEVQAECDARLRSGSFRRPDLCLILDNEIALYIDRIRHTDEKVIEDIFSDRVFAQDSIEFYRIYARENEPDNTMIIAPMTHPQDIQRIITSAIIPQHDKA